MRIARSAERRFWQRVPVQVEGECWLWLGYRFTQGYGGFKLDGRLQSAHRLAWELINGPIPQGQSVLHRCDVRPCVNPAHLFLGTQADNMRDAAQKGRLRAPRTRKLTLAERLFIFNASDRSVDLARRFGVSEAAIPHIRHGRLVQGGFQSPARFHQPSLRRADGTHPALQEGDPIRVRRSR